MRNLKLRTKYLLVLNGVILTMWTVYAAWSLHKTEEQFMSAEVGSLRHLAIGLGLLVEHHLETHGSVIELTDEIDSLRPHQSGLDIMLIDDAFVVRLATQEDRIGKKWFEEKIKQVFRGHRDGVVTDKEHQHGGRRAIDITVGVRSKGGEVVYVVHIARWLDHLSGALNTLLISHGLFALAMLLAVGAAVNLLTYLIVLRPLQSMSAELNETGWLSSRSAQRTGNEIESVHASLHDAIGQINRRTSDLQQRLKRSERLAVIGQMGAALAHEIRNPLHIVRGTAETMQRRLPEGGEFAADIKEEVDRVERLIEELLHYTRQAEPQFEEVDAGALLESVRERVEKSVVNIDGRPLTIDIEARSTPIELQADPVMMEQALTNLVINAIEASPAGEPIQLVVSEGAEGEVVFDVIDSGTGIAEEDISRATEPFFTRKARGTGLGLAVVEKIADLHDGNLTLHRRDIGGTRAEFAVSNHPERMPR